MVHLQLLALFACICITRSVEIVRNHTTVSFDSTTTIQDGSGDATEFGLSLAMVKQNGRGWAFIGAPNAEAQARNQAKFGSRPGKVWRCSLDSRPSCIDINYLDQLCTNKADTGNLGVICEKMRLGGTVLATDNLVIACAPRWGRLRGKITDIRQRMDGACLWNSMNESLKDEVTIPNTMRNQLVPFAEKEYSNPVNQLTKSNISRWFYAEFGFSTHMSRTEKFVSGTPGILVDQGGVVLSPIIPYETQWKWRMYHLERVKSESFDLIRGYMGYAVTSGFYFESNKEMIVASSPRAQGQTKSTEENLLGAVVMMPYDSSLPSEDLVQVKLMSGDGYTWQPDVVLVGLTFASYFGATLESVDINKDNLDDLLVGAPFQDGADDNGDFTKANTGCVYIYSEKWIPRHVRNNTWNYSKRLCESSNAFARFGTTIAKLGDIDYDGYNDFAVGAPYDDNGAGAVYIYFGQEDWKTDFKFIKLTGKSNDIGFGHSITGNVDADGNDTPDFVVGSYLTQQVTLFRTRPKLEVELLLKFYRKDLTEAPIKLRLQDESFSIQYCIKIKMITLQPKGISRTSPIEIWNQLTLDEDFGRFQISNEQFFKLNVPESENEACKHVTVTRSKKTGDLENDDDVHLTALVYYNETFLSHSIAKINGETDYGVTTPLRESFQEYCSDCPFRMRRLFKGREYGVSFAMDCKARWENGDLPTCRPLLNLSMRVTSGDNENVEKLTLGKTKDLKVIISVRNDNQTAFNPELRFTWNWESKSNTVLAMESLNFVPTRNDIRKCDTASELCELIQNKLRKHRQKTVDYTLNFDNVFAVTREPATLHLRAKVYLQNDTSFTAVGSYSKVNVIYDASVSVRTSGMEISLPLSAPKTSSAHFKLEIKGDTRVKAKVFVGLPITLSRGYNSEKLIHVDSAKGWSCKPETRWPGMSRQMLQSLQANSAKARVNCFVDRASCIYFFCTKNIERSHDEVIFNFNVTEANALRMKSILESIGKPLELAGFAYANIFDDSSRNDSDHSVTLFKMIIKPADTQKLAAWIIIVAAGCGLIVVCCLIFALFQCGFFKRKARDDLARLKAEAEVEEAEAACAAQNPPKSSGTSETAEGNSGNVADKHKSDD